MVTVFLGGLISIAVLDLILIQIVIFLIGNICLTMVVVGANWDKLGESALLKNLLWLQAVRARLEIG